MSGGLERRQTNEYTVEASMLVKNIPGYTQHPQEVQCYMILPKARDLETE